MKIEVFDSEPEGWNELLAVSPQANIFQTAHWADYCAERFSFQPKYLVLYDQAHPLALLLFFVKGFGQERFAMSRGHRLWEKSLRRILPVLHWLQGPAITEKIEETESIVGAIVDYLIKDYIPKHGLAGVDQVQLPYDMCLPATYNVICHKYGSLVVNLGIDEKAAWDNLKSSGRKAIRRGGEKGVFVKRITTDDEFHSYYDFARKVRGQRFDQFGVELTRKYLAPDGGFEIFLAFHEGKIINALGIWQFGGVCIEWGSFNTHPELFGGDMIKWEIIKWGIEQKFKSYDLAGIALKPTTEKEANIRRFKEKWGGELVFCNTFSWFADSWRGRIVEKLRRTRLETT